MTARNYSSVAGEMVLQSSINSGSTSITVDTTTGLPATPFTAIIDPGLSIEEVVTCSGVAGTTLTFVRGQDGTTASSHSAGAKIRHGVSARDYQESNNHINASSGVHGLTGAVVGTTDSQTLDQKLFLSSDATGAPLTVQAQSGQSDAILAIKSSGGSTVASVVPSGRVATPGIDGSNTSTFTAGAAGTVPLIAKGAGSQTANLLSLRNSSDVELASFTAAGKLVSIGSGITGASILTPDAVGTVALKIQNIVSQTADVIQHLSTGAAVLFKVDVTGKITSASLASGITALTNTAAGSVLLTLKAAASQSANIVEIQDSTGTILARVPPSGRVYTPRVVETDSIPYASYTPTLAGRTSGGGIGNGTITAFWDQWRKRVHCYGKIVRGSTTAFGTGGVSMTLPVTAANFYARLVIGTGLAYDASSGARIPLTLSFDSADTALWLEPGGSIVDPNVPFTWATSDELIWDIQYEAA